MLTNLAVKKAAPKEKAYKLYDSGGLHLFVTPTGYRSWRLKYRFGGKEKQIVFGPYPELSLAEARLQRDEIKRDLRSGLDPVRERRKRKSEMAREADQTLERVSRDWFELQRDRWKPVHARDVITSLERDIFPTLGALPIRDIDQPAVARSLKSVQKRGAIETALRVRQRLDSVFQYAMSEGLVEFNPTHVKSSLKAKQPSQLRRALTDLAEIRVLVAHVDQSSSSPVTRLASRLMALTAQRPGVVRTVPWSEFEGIDWDNEDSSAHDAIWKIPADRMKQAISDRDDRSMLHVVPLSSHAVDTLRALHRLTGRMTLAFPSNRHAHKPLSENSVGYLYKRLGYQDRHVPHGWRSSFSTIMNAHFADQRGHTEQRLVIERFVIDLMLAHVPPGISPTERRYNRTAYLPQRREIAQLWGDWIMADQMPAMAILDGPRRS